MNLSKLFSNLKTLISLKKIGMFITVFIDPFFNTVQTREIIYQEEQK